MTEVDLSTSPCARQVKKPRDRKILTGVRGYRRGARPVCRRRPPRSKSARGQSGRAPERAAPASFTRLRNSITGRPHGFGSHRWNRLHSDIPRASWSIVFPREHISCGSGVHRCVGSRLAELQLCIRWEEILKRNLEIEVMNKPTYLRPNLIHGIQELPMDVPQGPIASHATIGRASQLRAHRTCGSTLPIVQLAAKALRHVAGAQHGIADAAPVGRLSTDRPIFVIHSPGATSANLPPRRPRCCDRRREVVRATVDTLKFVGRPSTSLDPFALSAHYAA